MGAIRDVKIAFFRDRNSCSWFSSGKSDKTFDSKNEKNFEVQNYKIIEQK